MRRRRPASSGVGQAPYRRGDPGRVAEPLVVAAAGGRRLGPGMRAGVDACREIVGPRLRAVGLQRGGAAVVVERGVDLPIRIQREGEAPLGARVGRIEPDGFLITCDGGIEMATCLAGTAEVQMSNCIGWCPSRQAFKQGFCLHQPRLGVQYRDRIGRRVDVPVEHPQQLVVLDGGVRLPAGIEREQQASVGIFPRGLDRQRRAQRDDGGVEGAQFDAHFGQRQPRFDMRRLRGDGTFEQGCRDLELRRTARHDRPQSERFAIGRARRDQGSEQAHGLGIVAMRQRLRRMGQPRGRVGVRQSHRPLQPIEHVCDCDRRGDWPATAGRPRPAAAGRCSGTRGSTRGC